MQIETRFKNNEGRLSGVQESFSFKSQSVDHTISGVNSTQSSDDLSDLENQAYMHHQQ